jgi:hypothetical protein
MAQETKQSRWDQISAPTLASPERKARYKRARNQVLTTRQILLEIDAERDAAA